MANYLSRIVWLCPTGEMHPLKPLKFFSGSRRSRWSEDTFYLLRNAPPPALLNAWAQQPAVPVRKFSHRLLMHLRKTQSNHGVDWEQLCVAHPADAAVYFRIARRHACGCGCWRKSERDKASGSGTATNGQPNEPRKLASDKPEILDDPRLEPATQWLRQLDWFTPEPGLWVGDANENFLELARRRLAARVRRKRNISATRRFTGCSSRRASSSRAWSSKAAALTGSPFPPNGSRKG